MNKKDELKGCQKIGVQNSPASGDILNRDHVIDCNDSFVLKRKKWYILMKERLLFDLITSEHFFISHEKIIR